MKAVCEGIDLSDAVLKVVKACASKTTVPVLECIKISAVNDTLTLSATDGEISIQKNIKAEIYEEGDVCVPGKYFADFIKPIRSLRLTSQLGRFGYSFLLKRSQLSARVTFLRLRVTFF